MRTEVMFRDLPGGPVMIEFSDEIPRRSKCSTCQMISLEMYADAEQHVFCNACVCAASDHEHIYCNAESRNIPLKELFDAHEVLCILRKMALFCPNKAKGCDQVEKLETIADHYEKCKYTSIECKVCKASVPGREYNEHEVQCRPMMVQCPRCSTPVEKKELLRHKCRKRPGGEDQHEHEQRRLPQHGSPPEGHRLSSLTCPSEQRAQPVASSPGLKGSTNVAQGTKGAAEEKVTCNLCGRQVRKLNLKPHLGHCENVQEECKFCRQSFSRVLLLEHRRSCSKQVPPLPLSSGASLSNARRDTEAERQEDTSAITAQPRSSRGIKRESEETFIENGAFPQGDEPFRAPQPRRVSTVAWLKKLHPSGSWKNHVKNMITGGSPGTSHTSQDTSYSNSVVDRHMRERGTQTEEREKERSEHVTLPPSDAPSGKGEHPSQNPVSACPSPSAEETPTSAALLKPLGRLFTSFRDRPTAALFLCPHLLSAVLCAGLRVPIGALTLMFRLWCFCVFDLPFVLLCMLCFRHP